MITPKDIKIGDLVGTVLIIDKRIEPYYSKTSTMFYAVCQNCKAERKITSSHLGAILRGRGKGCHCSRRGTDSETEYKWRYQSYIQSAKKRGLSWDIDYPQFLNITKNNCHYCNASPEMRPSHSKRWEFKFPMSGIDRIDSSRGYEADNIVACCSYCNQAKWDHDVKDFLEWIKRVYSHQYKENHA